MTAADTPDPRPVSPPSESDVVRDAAAVMAFIPGGTPEHAALLRLYDVALAAARAAPQADAGRLPIHDCGKDDCMPVEHWQRIAMSAFATPAGLDVERLAEAWRNVMDGRHIAGHVTRIGPDMTTSEDWRNIADEYAALGAAQEKGEAGS